MHRDARSSISGDGIIVDNNSWHRASLLADRSDSLLDSGH